MSSTDLSSTDLTARIDGILGTARRHSARSVNSAQVLANWLIGREIVVEEQDGRERAVYGEKLIPTLAAQLRKKGVKGYGATNLKLCRLFHLEYPNLLEGPIGHALRDQFRLPAAPSDSIRHSLRDESQNSFTASDLPILHAPRGEFVPGQFTPDLSWTHYRALLKVSRHEARAFYEIEAICYAWSARELERQINSFLTPMPSDLRSITEFTGDRDAGSRRRGPLTGFLNNGNILVMTTTLEAIYEAGSLRLLGELSLPENTRVVVRVETPDEDSERQAWLAAGESSLMKVWDNDADDVYNELLAP